MNNLFCQLTTGVWDLASVQMNRKPHISESKKKWPRHAIQNGLQNLWGDMVFFILCQGIWCHCSYKLFPYITLNIFAILYPTSLANLVVEVGVRHSHQILLGPVLWLWFWSTQFLCRFHRCLHSRPLDVSLLRLLHHSHFYLCPF